MSACVLIFKVDMIVSACATSEAAASCGVIRFSSELVVNADDVAVVALLSADACTTM